MFVLSNLQTIVTNILIIVPHLYQQGGELNLNHIKLLQIIEQMNLTPGTYVVVTILWLQINIL